jgi:hypothetical protein
MTGQTHAKALDIYFLRPRTIYSDPDTGYNRIKTLFYWSTKAAGGRNYFGN